MNCGYKEKIMLYFYGELPGGAAELEAHLAVCASCAADLAVLKSLSAGFSAFRPEPPVLRAFELVQALPSKLRAEVPERSGTALFMAGFGRLILTGAAAAVFLLAFQALTPGGGTVGWGELDARLDSVEYRIYRLQDDMAYSSAADFDYGCADLETQKERKL